MRYTGSAGEKTRSPKGRTLSWDDYLDRSRGPHAPCPAQQHGPLLVPEVYFLELGRYVRFVARPLYLDVTQQKLISAMSGGRGK